MSTQRIAVGVDLESSELAVEQAMSVARRWGAQIVLLYVGAATPAARRALEDLRQGLNGHGVEISHAIADGTADFALADRARELDCGLIVVGTHDRSGVAHAISGSVAERTVRFSDGPVLVARGDSRAAEGGFRRIVVGTDYGSLADVAIAQALELAAPDAHVRLVHAWSTPAAFAPEHLLTIGDLHGRAAAAAARQGAELLACWRAAQPDRSIGIETFEGTVHDVLAERARTFDADLVAVGSHGRRGVRRLVFGSVSEGVAHRAPCSVLVARAQVTR